VLYIEFGLAYTEVALNTVFCCTLTAFFFGIKLSILDKKLGKLFVSLESSAGDTFLNELSPSILPSHTGTLFCPSLQDSQSPETLSFENLFDTSLSL
jgi:hypothetical protein